MCCWWNRRLIHSLQVPTITKCVCLADKSKLSSAQIKLFNSQALLMSNSPRESIYVSNISNVFPPFLKSGDVFFFFFLIKSARVKILPAISLQRDTGKMTNFGCTLLCCTVFYHPVALSSRNYKC